MSTVIPRCQPIRSAITVAGIVGYACNNSRIRGSNPSTIDPAGRRRYVGATSLANAAFTGAAVTSPAGVLYPQLAQVAIQTGRHAARQIARLTSGQPTERFSYFDKGMMAIIGRNAAVVQMRRLRLTGRLAWLAWGVLHLGYLPGTVNRVSTGLKYLWWHLTHENVHRVLLETEQDKAEVT